MNTPEKQWIVIEGDNGTGKDTLANALNIPLVINKMPQVKVFERIARNSTGITFMRNFLEYNRVCAEQAIETREDCVLIRYWPSTLAGAFADEIINEQQLKELIDEQGSVLPLPSVLFYLRCDFRQRIDRIDERNRKMTSPPVDDRRLERGQRHSHAMEMILPSFSN